MPCVNASASEVWGFHTLAELHDAFQKDLQQNYRLRGDDEFVPDVDVFDTPEAFILHASLPGANREDIGVDFDSDSSEIQVSGVVHRNADEELMKKLVIKRRNVGVFKRKFRLGTRKRPASIDADHITAKLENGILTVVVPKQETEATEKRKIEIE
ncbi:HSP20-like chaperone [Kalaharituber pfeilii]|nr:HSP20-like chaperone [Kalaharituber pfeilii]